MERFSVPNAAKPYVGALRALTRTGVQAYPLLEESCLTEMPAVLAGIGSMLAFRKRRMDPGEPALAGAPLAPAPPARTDSAEARPDAS